MKAFLKQKNSIKWFYIICTAILIISSINSKIDLYIINIFSIVTIAVLFFLYSVIRYNHYMFHYSNKMSFKYLLLDNIPLFLGIVYLVLMDMYFIKKDEVNFLFCVSLVPFVIPTGIGNTRF